jgi:hypothetical protein
VLVFQIIPNLPASHQNASIEKMIGKIKINSGGEGNVKVNSKPDALEDIMGR